MFLIKTCSQRLNEIFDIPKISVGIIVYNGADYIEYVIKSIYEIVSQIIIVDGCVKGYGLDDLSSTDGTLEIIKSFKKKYDILNKIEIIEKKKIYKNKIEMQNEIAKRIDGDYYVKMDADEIWKKETLIDAIEYMKINNIDILKMPFYHFWLSFNNIADDVNGKWNTKHPRIWKWKKGYKHTASFNFFVDEDMHKVLWPNVKEAVYSGDRIYHFGYVRKLKTLNQKLQYYKTRGIEKYFRDTVNTWKNMNDNTQPTQDVRSWAEKFDGNLPNVLKNHPYLKITDIRKYE